MGLVQSRTVIGLNFEDMLGKYLGGRQISGSRVSDFAQDITNKLPKVSAKRL